MVNIFKKKCYLPYVSIGVIACRSAIRLEYSSDLLIRGTDVVIHYTNSSIVFSDDDKYSQEARGITVTKLVRTGTLTIEDIQFNWNSLDFFNV